jgi:hypothetical protein
LKTSTEYSEAVNQRGTGDTFLGDDRGNKLKKKCRA